MSETFEFQSEARQLLQLMVHSVYSNKDVFLRELISNASDALDKLRLESFQDKELDADTSNLHIVLEVDKAERTLTVRDNGIGMTRDEVVNVIGTIAKSGTAEFLRKLKETSDTTTSDELIGEFGVGFYASFMVADKVTMVTRRAGTDAGVCWESTGDGTYTIEPAADAPQGTAITLHLKPEDAEDQLHDYTSEDKLREIVKRYSDFITWPVRLGGGEDALNSMKALWARTDVSDEEYAEFYRHVSHDWNSPLETIRLQAEGTFEYQALLFIPSTAPMDLFLAGGARRGVQLYVKRVFIMDDCDALMPDYLRFVRGVVDAQDLSLNVSREILQQDRQIRRIRRRLERKVLQTVKALPQEKYRTFWTEFGRVVKEGLADPGNDADNRELILEIASFDSTHDKDAQTTLGEYVERMPDGQEHIYYLTGRSRAAVEQSPHLEAFQDKGFEVLLLTDPIDEMWPDAVEFRGKRFRSVAKGAADLDTEPDAEQQQEFADLLAWMAETLADHVKEVRLSSRLTSSPACVVGDTFDITPMLEKMYRASGQQLPKIKRILELNPNHQLVTTLRAAHAEREDRTGLAEKAELVYGLALLAEGGDLPDPARFSKLLATHLAQIL